MVSSAATAPWEARRLPSERLHIALVGFMAAGKSSVGKILAARAGLRFVDLDEMIAQTAGQSIPDIFRDHGEVGFRARERAVLRELLAAPTPTVIATGGGTFIDPAMRDAIQRAARSVFLKTRVELLIERLGDGETSGKRPLAAGPDPAVTIRRLYNERTPAYEQSELSVVTDGYGIEEVAEELVRVLRLGHRAEGPADARRDDAITSARPTGMRPLLQIESAAGAYPVELRAEAGAWLATAIIEVCPGQRIAVISDRTVASVHAEKIVNDLRQRGKAVSLHTFTAGEGAKTFATAVRLYDELLQAGITRRDAAVAVGGGVVGDVTGFVASTILRGIRHVQVPTTTLAAVDASVGGKTAINTPHGKNLVGTFYPPKAVLIAGAHLATQQPRHHAAGLIEALKMAATLDARLFEDMVTHAEPLLASAPDLVLGVISRAVQLKAAIVARDEHETGDRAVLNYGHTVGHAIEAGEHYQLCHGEAVALGMLAESEWAVGLGMSMKIRDRLGEAIAALGLPNDWTRARVDLAALGLDKKRLGAAVQLPVIVTLGSFELRTVPLVGLAEFIRRRTTI